MISQIEEIFDTMAALPSRGRGYRYPAALKRQICRFFVEQRAEGVSWARLPRALSIPTTMLQRWHSEDGE